MDWITGMQKAIDYIEDHLTETIDYDMVAAQSFSSSYHFQRVFSILCGYTIGEYIRNRRLSLAGAELASGDAKVIDVALKYGYENPDSFARAFLKFHGILPSQAKTSGQQLNSFSRLVLKISLEGGRTMKYTIKALPEMTVTGYSTRFSGSAKQRYPQQHDFMIDGNVRFVRYALGGMALDHTAEYCVISDVTEEDFRFTIGREIPTYFTTHLPKTVANYADMLDVIKIPAHTYVHVETSKGYFFMDESFSLYRQVVEEWLPTSGYVLTNAPEITIIHQYSDCKENCYVELLLPIEKV